MELIRDLIEFVSTDAGEVAATLFPFAMIGLIGLFVLWLVIGYLRVSQVGIEASTATLPAVPLPRAPDGVLQAPRGVPYCPNDSLRYPAGARFCTQCEADLLVACANCGATIRAADESCYRCGTHATLAAD
ncbi:MAG: zinc ribbon domain-containing protein [Chloroflexota bacterium]